MAALEIIDRFQAGVEKHVTCCERALCSRSRPIGRGVNPRRLGGRDPQILGRGSWGVAEGRGRVVKYYILSCSKVVTFEEK